MTQAVEQLKVSQKKDSQTFSNPLSTDLLKKPEKAKYQEEPRGAVVSKRKLGGQPGHPGKTRICFGQVDRYKVCHPLVCSHCGTQEFAAKLVAVQVQQVSQLVERPERL